MNDSPKDNNPNPIFTVWSFGITVLVVIFLLNWGKSETYLYNESQKELFLETIKTCKEQNTKIKSVKSDYNRNDQMYFTIECDNGNVIESHTSIPVVEQFVESMINDLNNIPTEE